MVSASTSTAKTVIHEVLSDADGPARGLAASRLVCYVVTQRWVSLPNVTNCKAPVVGPTKLITRAVIDAMC